MNNRVAIIISNYNMPERTDALCAHIRARVRWPHDLVVVDNGSDLVAPSKYSTVHLNPNRQTTGGWLAGIDYAGPDYLAYWILITSTEFLPGDDDMLAPLAGLLLEDQNAAGVHPALTADSTTAWEHLKTCGGQPRRTWMIDNIAALWRADWLHSIGLFDPALRYAWGVDLEASWFARKQERGLWIDERVQVKKVTDIGYTMKRMNMSAGDRQHLAGQNMAHVLTERYGPGWWERMTREHVTDEMA